MRVTEMERKEEVTGTRWGTGVPSVAKQHFAFQLFDFSRKYLQRQRSTAEDTYTKEAALDVLKLAEVQN